MENFTSKYLINGPNNVVRLSDGNKVLYIFGDYHKNTELQNECSINDNFDSIDIDKFLLKFMKNEKERDFDLFIENDTLYSEKNNIHRNNYITQVRKLFNSKIIINNNKIIINKNFPNFRFHYFDIRSSLYLIDQFYYYAYTFIPLNNSFEIYISYYYNLIELNTKLIDNLNIFKNYLESNKNKYINKIKNIYQNNKTKNIINNIFNKLIDNNIQNCIDNTINVNKYINKNLILFKTNLTDEEIKIKIQSNIFFSIKFNQILVSRIFVVITDLFFIRRFIDKNYIKNGIIYTGLDHMNDICYILIKYFNFSITNIFYNNNFDLKKIPKLEDKNFDYLKTMEKYFDSKNENLEITQCINLFSFPNNFL
jgi:hypothetical protein